MYIARSLHDDAAQWPPRVWDFATLTLAAFYYHPDLDVARTQWATSNAAVITAGQRPNPAIQLPLQYTANATSGESAYTYGLGLDIPIETAYKRGYRIAQAKELSDAARFNIGSVAWHVRSRLRIRMLDLHATYRRSSILEHQIVAQREIVGMLEKRLALGAASAAEATQARIALAQERLSLADANRQATEGRTLLASAIGVPVAALANVTISFEAFERVDPEVPSDDFRQRAILNRADILGALAEYEASQAALQLELAKQYPDIHLGPGYTYDMGATKFAFSVASIVLPVFNRNEGPIAEANAKRTEIAARVNALQIQAINETDRALQDYGAVRANLALANSLFVAQRSQLQSAQHAFNTGETDRLTLALARHSLTVDELAREDALTRVQQAIGKLEDAMQSPLLLGPLAMSPGAERADGD
ncbi:MAG: TolC family protein [Casimicrobiaceae bacterium]